MAKKQPRQARPRADKGEWRKAFLEALGNTLNVRYACKVAQVSRKTAYQHKADDAEFAAAWREAEEDGADALEMMAMTRAQEGSERLLMYLLSAHRPEKFGQHHTHKHQGGVTLQIVEEIVDAPHDRPARGPK